MDNTQTSENQQILRAIHTIIYTLCRYLTAFIITNYGAAKIFKGQFSVPLSILDTPLGQVTDFHLTWAFFGASYSYSLFIASVQITCAILLLFRKTALLGAAILLPVMLNIVLIDIFYNIYYGALNMALFLTAMLIVIHLYHLDTLKVLFRQLQQALFVPFLEGNIWKTILKYSIRLVIIILPVLFAYYIRYYNNILPTSIDGKWQVEQIRYANDSLVVNPDIANIETLYFEPDFAFRSGIQQNGQIQNARFTVDEVEKSLQISGYTQSGSRIFEGIFSLSEQGQELRLTGTWKQDEIVMDLVKK